MSGSIGVAVVARGFGRDVERCFSSITALVAEARAAGASVLVLPEACLGGYLADLSGGPAELSGGMAEPSGGPSGLSGGPAGSGGGPGAGEQAAGSGGGPGAGERAGDGAGLPPALDPDGPEIARLAALAGDLVVCAGYCEADGAERFNAAVCVHDGRVLGRHRKVHQPLGEHRSYGAGQRFEAFDTPVGRMAMQICYDKAFPEAARTAALDGASIIASLSAWPSSATDPAPVLAEDRWTRRFDLFDQARALENQVVWAASNQAGTFGRMRFVGRAKVVGPGGDVLAATGTGAGMAVAQVDVGAALDRARRAMFHLRDRRPDAYAPTPALAAAGSPGR